MAQSVAQIQASQIAKDITVTVDVKEFRGWQIRLQIALIIMRFAIWIAGCNLEIEE
jgi:hypothetical protein